MALQKISIPRNRFIRAGLTAGRGWGTVTGVKFTYKSVAGATGAVVFDDLILKAGADGRLLSGAYKLRHRYVFDDGLFVDQSFAGPATDDIFVEAQAIQATLVPDSVSRMDTQTTAVWFYLFSPLLGAYYKVRAYLDLTMSKFSVNEFDPIVHGAAILPDDAFRHCTCGLLPGRRYTTASISDDVSDVPATTQVPHSFSGSMSVYSHPNWTLYSYWQPDTVGTDEYLTVVYGILGIGASTISSVTVTFTTHGNSYPEKHTNVTPYIVLGGVKYYGTLVSVGNDTTPVTYTWTINPATSSAFTESELDAAYFGLRGSNTADFDLFVDNSFALAIEYNVTETVVVSIGSQYNPYTLLINSSDTEMLLDAVKLDTSENIPPNNIINIVGPHYGRLMCLTPTHLYPSVANRPATFKYNHAIRVADGVTETALWAIMMSGGSLFVGTTKDIYRFDGDFQVLPDDTLQAGKIALGLGNPPVDGAVALHDDMLVYHAADGYRVLVGNSSTSVNNNIALLHKGYTRHDLAPSDPAIGHHDAAFGNKSLFVLYPYTQNVGPSLNEFVNISDGVFNFSQYVASVMAMTEFSTPADHANRLMEFDVKSHEWMPRTYPVDITCLYRTSSGRLVGGTLDGRVVQFETGNSDLGDPIEVTARTPSLDGGLTLNHKEMFELALTADSGGDALTYSVVGEDGSTLSTDSASPAARATIRKNMANVKARRFQLRLSGSFNTLRLYDFNMALRPVPQHRTYLDTGYIRVGTEEFHWFRSLRLMLISYSNLTLDIYFDGSLVATESLTVVSGTAKIYTVPLGREAAGRQPRLVIRAGTTTAEATTEAGFEAYWIEWINRESGRTNEGPRIRWDNSTNDNAPSE